VTLRAKLVLALVLLSATATFTVGAWSYAATSERLNAEVDESLVAAARAAIPDRNTGRRGPANRPGAIFERPDGDESGLRIRGFEQVRVQLIDRSGEPVVFAAGADEALPVDDTDRGLATQAPTAGEAASGDPRLGALLLRQARFRHATVAGETFRILTVPGTEGGAIQLARSLAETERVLDALRRGTAVAVIVVTLVAAAIGWLVARQVTRPLDRLTTAATEVGATGRLEVDLPPAGNDEVGRLAGAFRTMLGALATSRQAQQRLVQDAGHELRTPLTSLRTNIAVLRRHDDLPPETLGRVLDDLDLEAHELTALVDELVELAGDAHEDEPVDAVALAPLVGRVAERVQRRTGRAIVVTADDSIVQGRASALERAVSNLLDNAAKFDDSDQPLEVSVAAGRIEVCDRGPGIDPADASRVFDRFYRAVEARSRPGSGLGLAIVRDVAETHGGTVFATPRDGGGACVGLVLPADPLSPDSHPDVPGL